MTNYAMSRWSAVALGKLSASEAVGAPMAGKSTLNRIEHCPEAVTKRQESRYHRIGHNPEAIEKLNARAVP